MSLAEHRMMITLEGSYEAAQTFSLARADMTSLMRTTASAMGTMLSLSGSFANVERGAANVAWAQERLNDAIERYGAYSRQANLAQRQLDAATKSHARSQQILSVSLVSSVANLLAQTGQLGKLLTLKAADEVATVSQTTAVWAHVAALRAKAVALAAANPWLIPAVIAGAAIGAAALATAGGGGGGGYTSSFAPSVNLTIRYSEVDDGIDRLGAMLKEEARRHE